MFPSRRFGVMGKCGYEGAIALTIPHLDSVGCYTDSEINRSSAICCFFCILLESITSGCGAVTDRRSGRYGLVLA